MKQTDIEIYLKDSNLNSVTQWLEESIGQCSDWQQKGKTFKCKATQKNIDITWYEKAVGNWHCLYLTGKSLLWETDLDCALSANHSLNTEIRCAPNGWSETEHIDQDNTWLKITHQEVSTIEWKT